METKITNGYVSADGHVVEPADLWTTRMDKQWRERAPHIESRPDGDFFIMGDLPPYPVGGEGAMIEDKIAGEIKGFSGYRYDANRTGAWDPQARLADQELDHLRAEVIYPGVFGLLLTSVQDPEFQRACFRTYNDWLAEFCAVAPKRLLGVAVLPTGGPIEWTIAEAERAAKHGLRSVMMPVEPYRPYYQEAAYYEPLWPVLQDLGLPVAFHVATGKVLDERFRRFGVTAGVVKNKMLVVMPAAELISLGVPARYPKLRFVLAESGIGHLAYAVRFMDHWWTDHRRWVGNPEPPSAYFQRQFWATFEDDRAGLLTRELLNVDHLMWGSDYPHTEGTFPRSREQIAQDFAGIPEAEVYKIVAGNTAQLYGL